MKTGDSGIDSHSDNEDQIGTFKEEEIIRAQRRMKNFEPAPSNHETCYTETPAVSLKLRFVVPWGGGVGSTCGLFEVVMLQVNSCIKS